MSSTIKELNTNSVLCNVLLNDKNMFQKKEKKMFRLPQYYEE